MSALVAEDALFFEGFRLDRRGGGLYRRDESGAFVPVAIGSRALDVLGVLVARAGEVVSRDDIIAAVWPATVVEDNNLNIQIAALRRALDRDRAESCIRTIAGRGYRFVAPVTLCPSEPELPTAAPQNRDGSLAGTETAPTGSEVSNEPARRAAPLMASPRGRPRAYRGIVAGLAIMLMLAAAVAIVGWHAPWFGGSETAAPRLSIAVLPFADLSPGRDQQYFADAVTEDLTTDLSQKIGVFVISADSALTYRGNPKSAKEIGRELGVRYVVEGSVERAGGRVRVNAQLIDAESDAHLWAARFDREFRDLFELQSEITGRIAVALDIEMVVAEAARPIENPRAEDYIFRGREAYFGRPKTRANYEEAIGWYERALALDPSSAAAKTWLAVALINRAFLFPTASWPADFARAEKLIDEALAAGTRIPWAYYVKGSVLRVKGQWAAAIAEFEAALALDRNNIGALQGLGWCKLFTGALDEVIPLAEKGIRIDPRAPGIGFRYAQIGEVRELQHRPDLAIGWFEKARTAMPNYAGGRAHLAADYALTGDAERAAAELAAARRMNPYLYSSLAGLKASTPWGVPKIEALFEATYFAGLRKAGMPEE